MALLVDGSLWVHQLRKSAESAKRDRVNALLASGEAAWCPPVRLELWRGVTNDSERKTLRQYEKFLPITRFHPMSGNTPSDSPIAVGQPA
jgi:predicted nucleic acid-binding protein